MKQIFYVPARGDILRISPSAAEGHAPRVHPLAVVLSPGSYNSRVGLALVCPVISEVKGFPFEVPLPPDLPVAGVILADRPTSLDWRALRAECIGSLPHEAVEEVLGKLRALLA